ncbi:MAG TPA: LLM class flavin-dependent oxidoreductase [Miltoncostaeaceae bacterium]|nr:LLM class flavin-dependent oxidoreductase [Miltoncostaeaceae bacterium]
MEYGAHLPLIDFGTSATLRTLKDYARAAADLGYRYLCANDHLLFSRPWLDGLTALASVIEESRDLALATTIALPVIRGPVQLAKALTAIDVLSDGRLIVGVGPGSSAADYAAAGVSFDERYPRFAEAVRALQALLAGDPEGFRGEFYSTEGVVLEPRPVQRPRPPVWVAAWASTGGLRLAARRGDGWLASAYNTTPDLFQASLRRIEEELRSAERDLAGFTNAIGTAWLYVTEDARRADRILTEVLAPMLRRDPDALRALSLPIGPAEDCAERLSRFAESGARRVFVWPLGDDLAQLALFSERVVPLIRALQ